MTFDENGEINHACVVGEQKFTVSSSTAKKAVSIAAYEAEVRKIMPGLTARGHGQP